MIGKNIDIVAVALLLLGAALYSSAKQAALHAVLPLELWHVTANWEPPEVMTPLLPEPPLPPLRSLQF